MVLGFLKFVYQQHLLATIIISIICAVLGFLTSRTAGIGSQQRLFRYSAIVTGMFLALMVPFAINATPPGEGPSQGALYGILLSVSFYALILGAFFVLPISSFLLLVSLFAWFFSTFMPQRNPPHPLDEKHVAQPEVKPREKQRFGRRSKL